MNLRTALRLTSRIGKLICSLHAMRNQKVLSTREHLDLCADWLLHSQRLLGNGGYAASYSLVAGLQAAYIETTGYIIPTMLELAVFLERPECRASALQAGEWLLTVQQPDGAFTDIDKFQPQVFDTGQVLLGLNRLSREQSPERYTAAARRAGDWLVKVQDPDGSWTTMGYYRGVASTYHTRVAAALLELAQLTGEARYREAATRNLRWAAGCQQCNGFFLHSELARGADPVLHTMCYVLEGFLMAFQITGEREWLDVLLRGAEPLQHLNLERDLVLRSQYDASLKVTNPEKCVTGLAQWAFVCLQLHELTKDAGYLEAARLSIYYLKSKQLRGSGILQGALPGSVPLWGYYHPMMFPNWAVKFVADALLLYNKYDHEPWVEQESWVRRCFQLRLDGGGWEQQSDALEPLDSLVLAEIEGSLSRNASNPKCVLDIGCGHGRYLRHLSERQPNWDVRGFDPGHAGANGRIISGSVYRIPFADEIFDAAYAHLVLQHVGDIERALAEIRRVLKPGGQLVISDRNPVSARGLLKPWHEIKGRWMYPWDSPFRERWYTASRWNRMLEQAGFEVLRIRRINHPGDRGLRRLIPTNRFLVIQARCHP